MPEIERWIGNNQGMKSEEDERKDYQMDLCSYDSRVEHHRGCLWDAEDL